MYRWRFNAGRIPFGILAAGILALSALELKDANLSFYLGRDFDLYLDATLRWLRSGSFYEPYQLSAPYHIEHGAILYPPPILFLLIPFTVLPKLLWWLIPIAVTAWCLIRLSPLPVVWPVLALEAIFPNTVIKIMTGNPSLWVMAFVALGALYYWPAALALFKPTLAPVALFGSWTRGWWLALAVCLAATTVLATLWGQFLAATLNARTSEGVLYSVGELPMALIPITAWLGRSRHKRCPPAAGRRTFDA